jgi:succinyl-diaminopimelate desuccinylase
MTDALELTQAMIARPSVSPSDGGCQDLLSERLERIGFTVERLRFNNVDNFWARRGSSGPLLCLAGHTDVVPSGPLEEWMSDPFTPVLGTACSTGAAQPT